MPAPDYWECTLAEGHICLLTDDGSPTTTKLSQSLTEQGWKVVVLSFPPSCVTPTASLPEGINRVILEDESEDSLKQQLETIVHAYGSIGAFIHLHPCFDVNQNGKIAYLEGDKAIVKQVFLMAKHLKKCLNSAATQGYSCFVTVARLDGAFGLAHNVNFSPISAGLFGLTKTLNFEWKSVFCRAIDLNPALNAEKSAQYIIRELHDPNRYLVEVGYGVQGRTTLSL